MEKVYKKWTIFNDSRVKREYHPISEEVYKQLVEEQSRKEYRSVNKVVAGFKYSQIIEFGTAKDKHFPTTLPHDFEDKPYGIRTPSQHKEFVWVICGRPEYAIITEIALSAIEKMAWNIEPPKIRKNEAIESGDS